MRTEPDLDKRRLLDYLRERYRLRVGRLEFVPYGLDSWAYVATCRDGSRAFVKLTGRGPSASAAASETRLLTALADAGVPVPRPMADRDGALVGAFDGYDVQVLEYLEGRNLENEIAWADDLYGRLADLVAAVHASTPAMRYLVTRTEDYELPFLPGLAATVTAVATGAELPAGDDEALVTLRELVLPAVGEVRTAIGRLEGLRDLARASGAEEVLCHTDIWGSNLLLSPDRGLHLLDWNGARIAPPEADLFMFAGTSFFPPKRFGWFLDRYATAIRGVDLDADRLGFYLYRRDLEDLAGFVGDLVVGRTEAMPLEATLRIIAELLAEIPHLEGHIERARAVIDARRGT